MSLCSRNNVGALFICFQECHIINLLIFKVGETRCMFNIEKKHDKLFNIGN